MPKQIDKLKKARYKQARLRGNSIKGSLLEANYSKSTAHQSSTNAIVKQCEPELLAQVKASDITVEWVVNRLTQEFTAPDAKASDRIRVSELLGKYLQMFRDANITQVAIFQGFTDKDLPTLDTSNGVDVSSSGTEG